MQRELLTRDRAIDLIDREGRIMVRIAQWPGTERETLGTEIMIAPSGTGATIISTNPTTCGVKLDDGRTFLVQFGEDGFVGFVSEL